ncbi:DUF2846 domain-containing protein [Vogesella sp. LIG4]|uniref:DUF2846 domain-containing protein n=1 Tax=Vogesella sp. LIG4 TaxID=1192162 RepID=UPI00081F9837|nr:DUF2846 domain-containing protein [Vogesella sp. LIG4]SCK25652.1 Protein of unknown function [Vogesella sp. LIG4]
MKTSLLATLLAATLLFTGCASVPLGDPKVDAQLKTFASPPADKSGIYIYRNSFVGQALKKDLHLNGERVGETANKVYFYRQVNPGKQTLSTESEFSDNSIELITSGGKNYFVEQYIRMGVFVGGANLKQVDDEEGKKNVLESKLAQ